MLFFTENEQKDEDLNLNQLPTDNEHFLYCAKNYIYEGLNCEIIFLNFIFKL